MSLSNFAETKYLDHVLGNTPWTMPTTVYLGLATANPDDASLTEISGNGYARQAITFGAAASRAAANSSTNAFTASGGGWGTITHYGIFDALTGGNLIHYGALATSKTISGSGDSLSIAAGQIVVSCNAGVLADYLANAFLDHSLGTSAYTPAGTLYHALYTADPGDDDTGTEVSGSGYARQAITFDAASGDTPTTAANSGATVFTAAATWGDCTHWGIRDALTVGNLLFHGTINDPTTGLPVTKSLGNNDTLTFVIGDVVLTAD